MYSLHVDPSEYLSVLTYAPAEAVIAFVSALLPQLGVVEVLSNRTVLTRLPLVGEALVTECCVALPDGSEGYSAVLGTDTEQAIAVATLDAALTAPSTQTLHSQIVSFIETQARRLAETEDAMRLETA